MASVVEVSSCEAIAGNPDFYGLGIRIGVYLQWVTAWINLLVDPLSAQSIFDVNSVFVFAILLATMVASFADNPTIEPIETHILLQFVLGFFVTTLSTFGMRLHFLRPDSAADLGGQLKELAGVLGPSLKNPFSFNIGLRLFCGRVTLPLNAFSTLKPYHLSWTGVFWRTTTACMLAAVNIWLWFASHPNYRLPGQNCDPPFIFMFSRQQLSGSIVVFCKAVSIMIAAIVFPPFWVLLHLTIRLLHYMVLVLNRDLLHYVMPQVPQRLGRSMECIGSSLVGFNPATLPQLGAPIDFLYFLSKPSSETFRLSDLLKLIVYLGRGRDEKQREANAQAEIRETWPQKRTTNLTRRICILWNIFVILSIVWFILSIELTLRWNNIQGVYTIDSAGQLIPFVIGGVSTGQMLKNVVLLGLAQKYDDWADTTVDVSMDLSGNQGKFRIRTKTTLESEEPKAWALQDMTRGTEDTSNNGG
ncbi:hypothetical protein F5Y06DRAFT_282058 [Hypoxylon sp. FL0890]|nr:hypothetical protein F5Y06DRAFT_282058 [Hypoxylon sp. FL0890]